ncbi:hypothetical protein Hanom_Chr15g01390831 [Helianthus anomalus]
MIYMPYWVRVVTGLLFDPRVASPSPRGQANPSRFFVWFTGFVLPWTHQESGANSRPVCTTRHVHLFIDTNSVPR